MRLRVLFRSALTISLLLVMPAVVLAFKTTTIQVPRSPTRPRSEFSSYLCASPSKGTRGGGGFGAKPTASRKSSKKDTMKKLEQTYGGTSPQEIAVATQNKFEQMYRNLPPHLQVAGNLYQQLQKWDAQLSRLSILEQSQLPPEQLHGAQRAREGLDRLYREHNITEHDLHNIFQKLTWDASADAKAAISVTGKMSGETVERIGRACNFVAEALTAAGGVGRCLDVGCGYGVMIPHLTQAGVMRTQITGVDLSAEMIRNAKEMHPDVKFVAADFLNEFDDPSGFDGILICSSLHDMPDPFAAIEKASGLLRPYGKLVIVHPQGASHVLKQASQNPILVKRGLPTAQELSSLKTSNLNLVVSPADAGSRQESSDGYLAVLQKL